MFINHNSTRYLDAALSSMYRTEPALAIESIVVDNASQDREELVGLCRRHRARLLLLARNLGYGAAFNRGYRFARGRYVAVANPDLVFTMPALGGLVRFMDEHPQVGAASPQLYYTDGTPQPTARRFPRLRYVLAGRRSPLRRLLPRHAATREFLYSDAHASPGPVAVEALIGTLVVFRREALDAVRGFDERFFMYAEDMDICRRIERAGWGVLLVPWLQVTHHYGAVRRRRPEFADYQRLRALRRLLKLERGAAGRVVLDLACADYLAVTAAGWLLGLREYEHSWRSRAVAR